MPPDNDNPAALAKLLSDALAQVDDLRRQLAEAEHRASKAERLLVQLCPPAPSSSSSSSSPTGHSKDPLVLLSEADDRAAAAERVAALADARLRDAADAWASLERAMAATRAELARVLPAPPSPADGGLAPHAPPPLRTLSRVPTQIVTLPASPLTTGRPSFPSLPPPPVPNPRIQQPLPLAAQRSAPPPMPTSSSAAAAAPPPPNKKPRMEPSLPSVKKPREERARFSESPPPPPPPPQQQQRLQPPPSAETAPGHRRDGSKGSISAFSSGSVSDEGRNKRKRGEEDEENDELMNDDDDDGSRSDMSLDEMILAVSGTQPSSSHAGPQSSGHSHHASTASTSSTSTLLANPNSGNHIQHGGRRKVPVSAAHVAPLYPALNAQGHRQCRQCGQAGRYKDGKCVEKWGPGPAGPGTVCDRCRKKMKRVERRGYELVRDGPGLGAGSTISMNSTPSQSFSQSQSQSQSSQATMGSQAAMLGPAPGPVPAQSQSFSAHPAQRVHSPPQRTSTSPVLPTASSFLAAAAVKEASAFGSSSSSTVAAKESPKFAPHKEPSNYGGSTKEASSFGSSASAGAKEVSSFGSSRRASPAPVSVPMTRGDTLVDIPLRGFNYEPPTSSVRSGWMKSEEVEPVS